jgi:prepilin-type N-terminal cleavage/methylation domain-containing protein
MFVCFALKEEKMKKGFTLVELLAVMVAMFIVMGTSVVLLMQAFDFQRTNDQYADGMHVIDRFVVDFRNDIHAYGKPEIPTDGSTLLRWKTETETVDYVSQPSMFPDQQTIVRTVRKDGQKFGETYRLPERTTLWFTDGKDADAGLVALSLWTTPTGTETPKPSDLNPFDRTLPKSNVDPKYAGNWRTIIARY